MVSGGGGNCEQALRQQRPVAVECGLHCSGSAAADAWCVAAVCGTENWFNCESDGFEFFNMDDDTHFHISNCYPVLQ